MKPTHLHIHLEANDIPFWELTEDFDHAVYYNPSNGKKFTFPTKVDDIEDELVHLGCTYLESSIPLEVQANLRNADKKKENDND